MATRLIINPKKKLKTCLPIVRSYNTASASHTCTLYNIIIIIKSYMSQRWHIDRYNVNTPCPAIWQYCCLSQAVAWENLLKATICNGKNLPIHPTKTEPVLQFCPFNCWGLSVWHTARLMLDDWLLLYRPDAHVSTKTDKEFAWPPSLNHWS